ncbi:MAG TPA: sigma-70 family RNA polymerase sigma factor [Gemmata sp.]|nr:sigma-70 family RNA polymerase sigma factor [Gemmata sp.]
MNPERILFAECPVNNHSLFAASTVWHYWLNSRSITPSLLDCDLEFLMVGITSPQSVADTAELMYQFQRHYGRLLAMLERLIGSQFRRHLDPEDLLQNAYLRAQQRWPVHQANGLMSVYPFLYQMARDTYAEAYRRLTAQSRDIRCSVCIPESSAMILVEALMADGTTPSEAVDRKDVRQLMSQTLNSLRREYREILEILYFDGLSVREASEVLGITPENTSQRHCRALKRLKTIWLKVNRELP